MVTGQHAEPTATRPLTGAEYLESLRDGREVWIYGERIKNIAEHPAFRNTARMVARSTTRCIATMRMKRTF